MLPPPSDGSRKYGTAPASSDVRHRGETAKCQYPVSAQQRNQLPQFGFERPERVTIVIVLAIVVQLHAIEAARSRVTCRPAPVERRARRAVDVAEAVELEATSAYPDAASLMPDPGCADWVGWVAQPTVTRLRYAQERAPEGDSQGDAPCPRN
jgi:hypothetical protein